jgi:hypothetical protein
VRDESQNIETENIEVYRLSTKDTVVTEKLPYKSVLQTYMNNILQLNNSLMIDLQLQDQLLTASHKLPNPFPQ